MATSASEPLIRSKGTKVKRLKSLVGSQSSKKKLASSFKKSKRYIVSCRFARWGGVGVPPRLLPCLLPSLSRSLFPSLSANNKSKNAGHKLNYFLQEAKRRREEQEKMDMEKIKDSIRKKNERITRLANKTERRKLFKAWAPKYVAGLMAVKLNVALNEAKINARKRHNKDNASNCIQRSWKKKLVPKT